MFGADPPPPPPPAVVACACGVCEGPWACEVDADDEGKDECAEYDDDGEDINASSCPADTPPPPAGGSPRVPTPL